MCNSVLAAHGLLWTDGAREMAELFGKLWDKRLRCQNTLHVMLYMILWTCKIHYHKITLLPTYVHVLSDLVHNLSTSSLSSSEKVTATSKASMRKHLWLQKKRSDLRAAIWTNSWSYKSFLARTVATVSTTTLICVSTRREQEWQFSRSSLLWLLYSSVPHLGLDTTVPEGTRGCWEKWQLSRFSAQMLPFMTAARWVGVCINVHCAVRRWLLCYSEVMSVNRYSYLRLALWLLPSKCDLQINIEVLSFHTTHPCRSRIFPFQ